MYILAGAARASSPEQRRGETGCTVAPGWAGAGVAAAEVVGAACARRESVARDGSDERGVGEGRQSRLPRARRNNQQRGPECWRLVGCWWAPVHWAPAYKRGGGRCGPLLAHLVGEEEAVHGCGFYARIWGLGPRWAGIGERNGRTRSTALQVLCCSTRVPRFHFRLVAQPLQHPRHCVYAACPNETARQPVLASAHHDDMTSLQEMAAEGVDEEQQKEWER